MKDQAWLILSEKGIQGMRKGQRRKGQYKPIERPRLERGEYAVLVSVSVPDHVFRPVPLPSAMIEVTEGQIVGPNVDVTVVEPPADPDRDQTPEPPEEDGPRAMPTILQHFERPTTSEFEDFEYPVGLSGDRRG